MKKFLRLLRKRQANRDIRHAQRRLIRIQGELADIKAEERSAMQSLNDLKLFVRSI